MWPMQDKERRVAEPPELGDHRGAAAPVLRHSTNIPKHFLGAPRWPNLGTPRGTAGGDKPCLRDWGGEVTRPGRGAGTNPGYGAGAGADQHGMKGWDKPCHSIARTPSAARPLMEWGSGGRLGSAPGEQRGLDRRHGDRNPPPSPAAPHRRTWRGSWRLQARSGSSAGGAASPSRHPPRGGEGPAEHPQPWRRT